MTTSRQPGWSLSTIASNLANANSVSGNPDEVFRAKQPVFSATPIDGNPALAGVRVDAVNDSTAQPLKRYEPGHPLADAEGYVYAPDIDPVVYLTDCDPAEIRPGTFLEAEIVGSRAYDLVARPLSVTASV